MKDREVQFPSRYRLDKVAGTDDVFDLVPVPGTVYEEGTFINKANLLKDATASLFDLPSSAVPDDVLGYLGKYNQYWWRTRTLGEHYEKVETTIVSMYVSPYNATYTYANTYTFDAKTGTFSLASAQTYNPFNTNDVNNLATTLRNCYFTYEGNIYYVGSNARCEYSGGNGRWYNLTSITSQHFDDIGNWQYIQSSNRNAYPDSGIVDNVEYEFLGRPLDNAVAAPKIEFGSYVGTGATGAGAINLVFSFNPKFVIIWGEGTYISPGAVYSSSVVWGQDICIMAEGMKTASVYNNTTLTINFDGNTLSYYGGSNAAYMYNKTGTVYHYLAIG